MKKWIIAISLAFLIIAAVLTVIFAMPKERFELTLEGNESVELELLEEYNEPGYTAKSCKREKCKDLTSEVEVENNISSGITGKYEVTYHLKTKKEEIIKKREVLIIDNVPPIIELIGEKEIIICPNKTYKEEGFKASDNYDGDLTPKVEITNDGDLINYTVIDESGNKSVLTRKITKSDTNKPVIELKGEATISIYVGGKYTEKGYSATDNCDGDLTKKVKVENSVNNKKAGTYKISYTVTDSSGNKDIATRTVIVKEKPVQQPTIPAPYQIKTKEDITNYIKKNNYNVAVGYYNLETHDTYTYQPNKVFLGASLIKTIDALYVYEKTNFNEATRKLVEQAISISNNTAHRKLVDQLGKAKLQEYAKSIGAPHAFTNKSNEYFSDTTVNEQLATWKRLYQVINNHPKGNELKKYFINSYGNHLLFNGIPTTMHKYGYTNEYYHNSGIVLANEPYIIIVLTKHGRVGAASVIQDISKVLYSYNQLS